MSQKQSDSSITDRVKQAAQRLIDKDPYLNPYAKIIQRRLTKIGQTQSRLTRGIMNLADFAAGHEYFGLHFVDNQWVFREWAPNASHIFLVGDMTGWQNKKEFALTPLDNGVWEIRLPAKAFKHKELYRLRIIWPGGEGDRIPAYARRVVQDPETLIFNAQVWLPPRPYQWRCLRRHLWPQDQ